MEEKARLRTEELAASESTIDAVLGTMATEFKTYDNAMANEIMLMWQATHQPKERVAPQLETFTTFAPPRMVDPFINRIQSEATLYQSYSHQDAAEIFARWHSHNMRLCAQTLHWYCWDGQRWKGNSKREVMDALDHFLGIYGQAAMLELGSKAGLAKQLSIDSRTFKEGTFSFFEYKQELACDASDLDPDDWTLNTPMGLLDLKTGKVIPHSPDAMCTKITTTSPDPAWRDKFEASRFAAFLNEIFENVPDEDRAELIAFEQASLGYCLTGDSSLHFLKFWCGEGRNGKSTLGEVVLMIMGDYAKKVNNALLMMSNYDAHPTEIANLMGIRLAIASEISEGSYINESLVKELTGDANLSARFMRCDFFEFRRTHKHLIYGNTKPRLRVSDAAIKARLKLTPFEVNFEETGRVDPRLKLQLMEEAGIVLGWLAEGAAKVWAAGMALPRSSVVDQGTEEYMAENDLVKLWTEERCVLALDAQTKNMTLYEDYRAWRTARGEKAESIQRWGQTMNTSRMGLKMVIVRGVRHLKGIGLRSERDEF